MLGIAAGLVLTAFLVNRSLPNTTTGGETTAGSGAGPQQRLAPVPPEQARSVHNSTAPLQEPSVPFSPETVAEGFSALARHRAAVLGSACGTAPIGDLLRGLVEGSGGPEVQLVLQALALRKAEAVPLVKARLRTGELWEKVMLTKFLTHCPWPETRSELRALVRSGTEPWPARQGAVSALGALQDTAAGPDFVALLRDPQTPVGLRLSTVAALSRIGYRDAIPVVQPLAQEGDLHLRLFATRALAEFGEPVDQEFLQSALRHDDYVVRVEACEALVAVEGTGIAETLQSMARNDFNEAAREAAAQAVLIRECREQTGAGKLSALQHALADAGRPTALWIIRALLREGGPEGRALVENLGAQDTWLGERCRTHLILTAGE